MSVDAVSALERGVRRAPHTATLDLLIAALELSERDALELKETASRARARSAEAVAEPPSAGGNLSYPVTSFIGRQAEVAAAAWIRMAGNGRIRGAISLSTPARTAPSLERGSRRGP